MATLAQFDGIVLVEYITPAFNTIQPPTDNWRSEYQRARYKDLAETYLSHHRLHPSLKISRHHSTSQPTIRPPTMSSSSSTPSSTSTAGSSSGSTGSHLPYAPFPYPLPSGGRGSGQQGK
ncbi:hypothetical protein SNOG_02319 [Parastagonospora nodorum SN15]|uniref:Uncharacterized protein n=2 Tax=Phaeosphaeria nodorum (strain SN15 / ATCC MYA-4574 / FGSC 10173) TaxID=321614 RepID=Q0V0Z5_PHANO|nr:hypothetical protein SNOG_02319 [Parastagonospora nodorum SN15]EAT90531.1 hypothetical protein SNOG_02319 [Parastagonospora nodorum SN15]